jgi:acyl-coenzyme A synthetase/AMP-(fatty) acid ligase
MISDIIANWQDSGLTIRSSGTVSKVGHDIFQSPDKLNASNKVALEAQRINKDSRILTVCKLDHAGGLLSQTLPGLSIGAHVDIVDFNAFRFNKIIHNYTHTHLTPVHCRILMKLKSSSDIRYDGLWITCGSDRVDWDIIVFFVSRGATFMANWGMSEIGPIAINTVFDSIATVLDYNVRAAWGYPIMGDTFYCDYKIDDDGELYVRGDICVYDDWFATGDIVRQDDGVMCYNGRKSIKSP